MTIFYSILLSGTLANLFIVIGSIFIMFTNSNESDLELMKSHLNFIDKSLIEAKDRILSYIRRMI
jgi:uncharacterized membrane protein